MSDNLKLCIDCAFFLADTGKCGHETAVIVDFTMGNHQRFNAQTHRQWKGAKDCGPEAKFFQPTMVDITPVVRQIAAVAS